MYWPPTCGDSPTSRALIATRQPQSGWCNASSSLEEEAFLFYQRIRSATGRSIEGAPMVAVRSCLAGDCGSRHCGGRQFYHLVLGRVRNGPSAGRELLPQSGGNQQDSSRRQPEQFGTCNPGTQPCSDRGSGKTGYLRAIEVVSLWSIADLRVDDIPQAIGVKNAHMALAYLDDAIFYKPRKCAAYGL